MITLVSISDREVFLNVGLISLWLDYEVTSLAAGTSRP